MSRAGVDGALGKTRRVAGFAVYPFFRKALDPIVGAFDEGLVSGDLDEIAAFRPDVVLVPEGGSMPELRPLCDARHAFLVGLRHGAENKYIAPEREYELADFVCGSDWDRERFEKFAIRPRRGFLLTGNPWVDGVFRLPRRSPRRDRPTILFAPTYNPETSACSLLEGRLVPAIREVWPDARIVIKPHPHVLSMPEHDDPRLAVIREHRDVFARWVRDWEGWAARDPGVRFVTDREVSITRFFDEADILVSDGSSLVLEFMALDRPILLYTGEEKVGFWEYDPEAPGNAWRDLGLEFRTVDEFRAALATAFERHDAVHSAKQRAYTERLHGRFRDGRSGERVVRAIEELPWLDALVSGDAAALDIVAPRLVERLGNTRFAWLCDGASDAPALRGPRVAALVRRDPAIDPVAAADTLLALSSAPAVLAIHADRDVELRDATFVGDAERRLAAEPSLAACGRVTGGVLRNDHAVFDRARLLAAGGFAATAGLAAHAAWSEEPRLAIGAGLYPSPGGDWWWLGETGSLEVRADVSGPWSRRELVLGFRLATGEPRFYPRFPVNVRIAADGAGPALCSFERGGQANLVEIPIAFDGSPVRVTLSSDFAFRPSELGLGDFRLLSVILSELRLTAPRPSVGFGSGFHADEGGWRWMGSEGQFVVDGAGRDVVDIDFECRASARPHYRRMPFGVDVFAGHEKCGTLVFADGGQSHAVQLRVPANARVTLRAAETFVPAEAGFGGDGRRLSVRVANLRIA